MTVTVGVFALQGDVREHLQVLHGLGVRALGVRRPAELDQCDALVLPGGESTTMAKLARTFDLFEPIRKRLADGMPTLGTCAGMILLADRIDDGAAGQETFGGLDMTVRRNAFGRQVDSFEGDVEFAGLTEPVHAIFIRAPWVGAGRPRASRCSPASGDGAAAGRIVAVRQGHLMATSFHPEVGRRRRGCTGCSWTWSPRPDPTTNEDEEGRMSGHSKWATTKHKKAVIDAKRGKMFAKLIKNIEVAARMGGGDPTGNPTLYDAIQKAKKSSVPNDNIDRAVKRGSGAETGGADYQTIMYEGYGPSGVAMLIECLTDNRNRAAMEVRTAMTPQRRLARRPGLGVLPLQPQGRGDRPGRPGGPDGQRGRRPRGRPSTPAPRRSTTWGSRSR